MKHLWEVEHPYYCNLANYFSNDCGDEFDNFDDFLEAYGDADRDMNLVFRWDWIKANADNEMEHDELRIFWMKQRKGCYSFTQIKITDAEEEKVKSFLIPRFEHLKKMWQPLEELTNHNTSN